MSRGLRMIRSLDRSAMASQQYQPGVVVQYFQIIGLFCQSFCVTK